MIGLRTIAYYYNYVYAIEQGVDSTNRISGSVDQWISGSVDQWILVLLHANYEALPTGLSY